MESLPKKVFQFPKSPGVYLMKGEGGKIIYVGKANNLRDRVKSYFGKEANSRYQVSFLMKRVCDIDYLVTQNEKEALLLENSLIKKHKPRYNIFLKDDKSYISLKLTTNHPFPQLIPTRRIKKDGALYFGPYSNAHACRETADFIYHHFQLRTCSDHEIKNRSRPCLEYQMKRCTAPCVGYVSQEEYAKQVEPVRLFLEGKNQELVETLEKRMEETVKKEEFEKAALLRDLLKNIEVTLEKQRVVKHGGMHQDIIDFYRVGQKGIIAVLSIRGGSLVDSHYYPVDSPDDDSTLLENFVNQYYLKTEFIPDEILIPYLFASPVGAKIFLPLLDILSEKKGKKVVLKIPQKGEKKELLELAKANAKAQFDKLIKKELQVEEILISLQKKLGLRRGKNFLAPAESAPTLHRIECYDISNISGTKATGSRIVFIDGEANKNDYRQYKIRLSEGPDDYGMMREVLGRRFGVGSNSPHPPLKIRGGESPEGARGSYDCPDLLVIDGGKGQLNIALEVLKELHLEFIPVIAIAKGKGKGARAKGVWEGKKEEEIYLPHRKNPLILKKGSPELMLLQRIRDEAHRFAVRYHRKLRDSLK